MSSPLESLDAIGQRHGTDKSSVQNNFLNIYGQYLEDRRMQPVKVLEIGVFNGGSVKTWRDYFPKGEIIGADINPETRKFADKRIRIEIADQSSIDDLSRLASLGPFDLVLDDGSHVWSQQILTFRHLIGSVKPGGYYVVEDLDTSYGKYIPVYSGTGGVSAAEYLKSLSDLVVGQWVLPDPHRDPTFGTIWPLVDSITFYRGTALIRRKDEALQSRKRESMTADDKAPPGSATYKDHALSRRMLANYNPNTVDTRMSPNETMKGDNYFWVGATAAEAVIAAVMASRLTDVTRVLDLPCGHGRVLRYLAQLFPDAKIDAGDLDADGVRFCAETFGARPIPLQEDLTQVRFDTAYDLIWIGSLFTHTSYEITAKWLALLAGLLSENGIIVATFHGRWVTRLHKLVPYTDDNQWAVIMDGYNATGYGYHDDRKEQSRDFAPGNYGLSVARPHTIVKMIEDIPRTRIFMYQEQAWGDNHDVVAFGRPDWDQSWWPK